jgi:hypothetical protein
MLRQVYTCNVNDIHLPEKKQEFSLSIECIYLISHLEGESAESFVGEVAAGELDLLHSPDPLTQHAQGVVVQSAVLSKGMGMKIKS